MVLDGVRLAALWRASNAWPKLTHSLTHSRSRLPRLLRRAKLPVRSCHFHTTTTTIHSTYSTLEHSHSLPEIYATLHIYHTAMSDVETPPVQEAIATDQNPLANMEVTDSAALVPTNQDSTALEPKKKTKKIMVKKKRRPARVQQEGFSTERPAQTGTIFNIWYNKWSGGDREDAYSSKQQAKGRCNVATDSGYTLADTIPGSYFCVYFARGLCPKGQDCEYLHRLPNSRVEKEGGLGDIFPSNVDCFGRDKFSDYRDDMGGVGSFMRVNRTLYVGRIHTSDDIEEVVARHFQEWGQIERVRVLPARGVAFVTYVHLANAVSLSS
jgi:hypothetical protein